MDKQKQNALIRECLLWHAHTYPLMQAEDVLKLIHQSTFGCGHIVSSPEAATSAIRAEAANLQSFNSTPIEPLNGAYTRVSLAYLGQGLRAETLGQLLYLSAKQGAPQNVSPEAALIIAQELIKMGKLSIDANRFAALCERWRLDGYPPLHHSEAFRKEYSPSYRVIANDYVPFLSLFAMLDRAPSKHRLVLAIEGGSASGKTTLACTLAQIYGCTIFHMDDFFLRPEQRTPSRLSEPGGNVDRERFLAEILLPLTGEGEVCYRPFDCRTMSLTAPVTVTPHTLTVIEGTYSMHPTLSNYYDLSVFLDISPKLQKERITKRNSPALAERFFNEWIPLEHGYFEALGIKEKCDLVVKIG